MTLSELDLTKKCKNNYFEVYGFNTTAEHNVGGNYFCTRGGNINFNDKKSSEKTCVMGNITFYLMAP